MQGLCSWLRHGARIPSGAPRAPSGSAGVNDSRSCECPASSFGISGHRDWHGGVVGSPVLGLRSMGRCSARGDNAEKARKRKAPGGRRRMRVPGAKRACLRKEEAQSQVLSRTVWRPAAPSGSAVGALRVLELQLLGGKCADLGDAAVSLSGCAIAARVPSGAPRLLRDQRASTSRGVSGHRDWHGGVVGSPALGLRSTGKCSARGDNAYQDHAGGTRGSTKQLCQWIKEQQVVAPPAETPSPVLSGTVEFRGPLGAPRFLRDQRASVFRGLLGAPRLLRDQRLVRHVSVEDLIDPNP